MQLSTILEIQYLQQIYPYSYRPKCQLRECIGISICQSKDAVRWHMCWCMVLLSQPIFLPQNIFWDVLSLKGCCGKGNVQTFWLYDLIQNAINFNALPTLYQNINQKKFYLFASEHNKFLKNIFEIIQLPNESFDMRSFMVIT